MADQQSKASKLNQHGIPWAAVVVAALGWYDGRNTADDAHDHAGIEAQAARVSAKKWSETRARNGWEAVQKQFAEQNKKIAMLEGWVVELEVFIEADESAEDYAPRNARERAEAEEDAERRLTRLRVKKAKRERSRWNEPAPMALPDYGAVQEAIEIDGLPDFVITAAKAAAEEKKIDGHVITTSRSLITPFLQFSTRRDLRKTAYKALSARGANGGDTDNRAIAR